MTRLSPYQTRQMWIAVPFVVAVIILIGWFVLWQEGAKVMRASVAEFVETQRASGIEVVHDHMRAKGFPFFLRGAIGTASFSDGTSTLIVNEFYIDALPYALDRLIFSVRGQQEVRGDSGSVFLTPQDARASVENDAARQWLAKAQSGPVDIRVEGNEEHAFRVGSFLANVAPSVNAAEIIEVSLSLTGLEKKAGETSTSLGDTLNGFFTADALSETLEIKGFELVVGDGSLRLAGVVSLDRDGYPQGTLNAEIERPLAFAGILTATSLLTEREANAVASGLTLMALGSGGKITAPIRMQNGKAEIAGLRLASLPRLR